MEQDKKLAAVYMRMSTDRQEYSIDSQWRIISEWADRNGYTIIKRYEDAGVSAMESKLSKRVAFLQMAEDSETSDWRTVLIYDSSRFSRSLKDSIVYKSVLRDNGVQVISVTEPVVDEDTALIMDAMTGAQNELYIRKLSKNVRRGQEQKVLRGEVFSLPPFGYRRPYPGATFEIVPEEAEIVRYIYQEIRNGRTVYGLACELAKTDIRTRRGNPFDTRQVERILTNPIYKGWIDVTLSGKRYTQPSDHAPIIPEDEFDEMQDLLAHRRAKKGVRQKPRDVHAHWLSGKVRCSLCGGTYTRRANGSHPGYPSFICARYSKGRCAKPPVVSERILEQLVLAEIKRFSEGGDYRISVLPPRKAAPTIDYDTLISKATRSLDRAKQAYLEGIDTLEEYKANKAQIEAEIAQLQQEKEKAQTLEPDITVTRAHARELYDLLTNPERTLAEKQAAIDELVERITIYPDRSLSITYFSD